LFAFRRPWVALRLDQLTLVPFGDLARPRVAAPADAAELPLRRRHDVRLPEVLRDALAESGLDRGTIVA
jgi:hypothetical protein